MRKCIVIMQRIDVSKSSQSSLVRELHSILRQEDALVGGERAVVARAVHAFTARIKSEVSLRIGDLLIIQPQVTEVCVF